MNTIKKLAVAAFVAMVGLCSSLWAAPAAESDFGFDSTTGTITKYNGDDCDVVIPSTIGGVAVTAIGNESFDQKDWLKSVTIPAGVTNIGSVAFWLCEGLTNVAFEVESQLKTISAGAFAQCGFTEITIPAGVTELGAGAFSMCSALTEVTVLAEIPPAVGDDFPKKLFAQSDALTAIRVPSGTAAAYKGADGWSTYADLITDGTTPAAETVETTYYAWNETKKAIDGPLTVNAIPVTAEMTTLESGWYVVTNMIAMTDHGLAVNGDAHLIIADGARLTIAIEKGSGWEFGGLDVSVIDNGQTVTTNSISIYGQAAGSGVLDINTAQADYGAAAIGCPSDAGNSFVESGTINIHGGQIRAIGNGAGIGGGQLNANGIINIYGGNIYAETKLADDAEAMQTGAAGIGNGGDEEEDDLDANAAVGPISIYGGTIEARGSKCAAGIGGGLYCKGGDVKIYGGSVLAVGGEAMSFPIGEGGTLVELAPAAPGIGGGLNVNLFADVLEDFFHGFMDPGTFTVDPGYAGVCIVSGANRIGVTNVTADAFGTLDAPGWFQNNFVAIGSEVAEIVVDGVSHKFPSLQTAFDSEFTRDPSVTNTITLLRDYTETRMLDFDGNTKFKGTTVFGCTSEVIVPRYQTVRLDLNGHVFVGGSAEKFTVDMPSELISEYLSPTILVGMYATLIIDDSSEGRTGVICKPESAALLAGEKQQVSPAKPRLGASVLSNYCVSLIASLGSDVVLAGGKLVATPVGLDGSMSGKRMFGVFSRQGSFTMSGGTIAGDVDDGESGTVEAYGIVCMNSKLDISGGKVKDAIIAQSGTVSISGGLFGTEDVKNNESDWLAEGAVCEANDDETTLAEGYEWKVTPPVAVAMIVTESGATTNFYFSVQEAFDSELLADQSVTNTVTLLRDYTETKAWVHGGIGNLQGTTVLGANSPRTARLDLNGYTLTGGGTAIEEGTVMTTLFVGPQSVLIIDDSSEAKTGAIRKSVASVNAAPLLAAKSGQLGAAPMVYYYLPTVLNLRGDLTLAGGTIHGAPCSLGDDVLGVIGIGGQEGRVTITGGEIVDCFLEGVTPSVGVGGANLELVITGGKVRDAIMFMDNESTASISGGLFGMDDVKNNPAWIASGYAVEANDDEATLAEGYAWKVAIPVGAPANPWKVGAEGSEETVQAYTNGNGKVFVKGTGTPKPFAAGAEPWAGAVPAINEIVVLAGRSGEFEEAWPGYAGKISELPNYLNITAVGGQMTVRLARCIDERGHYSDDVSALADPGLEYARDPFGEWSDFVVGAEVDVWGDFNEIDATESVNLEGGETIYVRRKSETPILSFNDVEIVHSVLEAWVADFWKFDIASKERLDGGAPSVLAEVHGNAMSLLDRTCQSREVGEAAFYALFCGCDIATAPELPATNLAAVCYNNMFHQCAYLREMPPSLPAEKVPYYGYNNMFGNCFELTTAAPLGVKECGSACCCSMFSGCVSLTNTPSLTAVNKLGNSCFGGMFLACSSLKTAPELPTAELAEYCYTSMFASSGITNAPALPATELAFNCYSYMFSNCQDLLAAPKLPAANLAMHCYLNMMYGCQKIDRVEVGFTQWREAGEIYVNYYGDEVESESATGGWLSNVAETGTFVAPPELPVIKDEEGNYIPLNWNVTKHFTLPSGLLSGGYVVSNVTDEATQVEPVVSQMGGNVYEIPVRDENETIEVYVKPGPGYIVRGQNPLRVNLYEGTTDDFRESLPKAVLPVAMIVTDNGETTNLYATVQEAFDSEFTANPAVTNTVTLLRDYTETAEISMSTRGGTSSSYRGVTFLGNDSDAYPDRRAVRLDLNGHTLAGGYEDSEKVSPALIGGYGTVLIIDDSSTAQTGAIRRFVQAEQTNKVQQGLLGKKYVNLAAFSTVVSMGCDFTLKNGTIVADRAEYEGVAVGGGIGGVMSMITIAGGTVEGCNEAVDQKFGIYNTMCMLTITGGKVKDKIVDENGAGVFISGGLFGTEDVKNNESDWLAPDHICIKNDDAATLAEGYNWMVVLPLDGSKWQPWKVGPEGSDYPQAITNGNGGLVIKGEGLVIEKPWLEGKDGITEITIIDPGVELPDDAFDGMGSDDEKIKLILPDNWRGELPDAEGNWYGAKAEVANVPFLVWNVKFLQRYPWNGLVDITADIMGYDGANVDVRVYNEKEEFKAQMFEGQKKDILFDENHRTKVHLVWDARMDIGNGFKSDAISIALFVKSAADQYYNNLMSELEGMDKKTKEMEDIAKAMVGTDFQGYRNDVIKFRAEKSKEIGTLRAAVVAAYMASNLVAGVSEKNEKAGQLSKEIIQRSAMFSKQAAEISAMREQAVKQLQERVMSQRDKAAPELNVRKGSIESKKGSAYEKIRSDADSYYNNYTKECQQLKEVIVKDHADGNIIANQNKITDEISALDAQLGAKLAEFDAAIAAADQAEEAAQKEVDEKLQSVQSEFISVKDAVLAVEHDEDYKLVVESISYNLANIAKDLDNISKQISEDKAASAMADSRSRHLADLQDLANYIAEVNVQFQKMVEKIKGDETAAKGVLLTGVADVKRNINLAKADTVDNSAYSDSKYDAPREDAASAFAACLTDLNAVEEEINVAYDTKNIIDAKTGIEQKIADIKDRIGPIVQSFLAKVAEIDASSAAE